ncbi:MAG: hypothetical protein ACFB4J_13220 [Elainellaceae cyanobacterium]
MRTTKTWIKWTYLGGLALLLMLAAIGVKRWTSAQQNSPLQPGDESVIIPVDSAASAETRPDVFQQAVNYAEQAAAEGQSAQTAEQWQQVAQLWRNAAMALNQVPRTSSYYELAHQKIDEYASNANYAEQARENALQRAAN